MKKVIFIGNISAGKTSLSQAIMNKKMEYRKTQSVQTIGPDIIDTPGEYLVRNSMRGALMVTSADAEVIILVLAATDNKNMFPPAYAGSFAKPVIGIVTKADIASEKEIKVAKDRLAEAGASKVFVVSNETKNGIDDVVKYLNK